MANKRGVFLDRDDTIMADVVYCKNPDDVRLLPGAADGIRALANAGFTIVIATNQSGIGRGYFTERDLVAVNERLREELRARGADFHALYYCPHRPEAGCACRKPRPGLIVRAATELGLNLTSSYTIGDRQWDIEAGKAAGTRTVLIAQDGEPADGVDFVAKDLLEAAHLILADASSNQRVLQ